MIRKPNFKLNWKYALGELTLIFLGISLAIWFDNWNDKRKRERLEREVLTQVYSDIVINKNDVEGDLGQLIFGLQSLTNIKTYFEEDRPYVDSMCFDFYWVKQDEYAFPITGAYDNLKSLGLDLIKNDSLRQYIQFAYEFGYPRISRDTPFHPDIDEYFTEYYQQNFVPNTDTTLIFKRSWEGGKMGYPFWTEYEGVRQLIHIGYVPRDYEALKNDPVYKMMLHQTQEYRNYKIRQYRNVREISNLVIEMIENELGVKPMD